MSSNLSNIQRVELDPHNPRGEYLLKTPKERRWPGSCLAAFLVALSILCSSLLLPALLPGRTNILLLGIDARPNEGKLGRTDTIILTSFQPLQPYVGMLTIPRDLQVDIADVGEERINTAYFFAEAAQTGSGSEAATETVSQNFNVPIHYYVCIRFDGLNNLVDALGGIEITLPRSMSGYPEGTHWMDGKNALAFVRDRSGSDDIFRNERALIFLKALTAKTMQPATWPRLPTFFYVLRQTVDMDIPIWLWPRLGIALLRVGPDGIDGHTITHEMVTFHTRENDGASVLLPIWELIRPLVQEIFGS